MLGTDRFKEIGMIRERWRWLMLRTAQYSNPRTRLKLLYFLEDPWNLLSDFERGRFNWTNQIIGSQFPQIGTILEVGCGEGHQSVYLSQQCHTLWGIDVSQRAVQRARRRYPAGRFTAGDVCTFVSDEVEKFDLVVACEVLYYLKNVEEVLERICKIGSACLVTYYQDHAVLLDPYFDELGAESAILQSEGRSWTARWWHNRA